ncbi:MAG TPA: phosphatase PAP2 family protein [Albitalea sp.]|uniref:phosphatase PAP2 family protein n=1 Tax=Piscinibacter sp. TaxID=1903157 RepID=UPI002ED39306
MSTPRSDVAAAFWRAAVQLTLLFAVVFYGVDAITAARAAKVRLVLDFEAAIPYWPAAFPVYFSVIGMPFLVRAFAPDAETVRRWSLAMGVAVVAAAVVYLLLPAQIGYPPADAGPWTPLARLASWIAGRHNLLPSLHVALTLITVLAVWPHAGTGARRAIVLWTVALVGSTLVTHQHHVLDLLAGAVLGVLASRARAARPRGLVA